MMKPKMRDLRIVTDKERLRLTYRDEGNLIHELASGPNTEKDERWLKEFLDDLVRYYGLSV